MAVSAAIDTVRPEFVDRNQELTVNLPIERAVVRGDFDQIDRVLVNLLSNASKYTPDGGRIDVAVAFTPGDEVQVVVADTGIGIPPDEVPHLFTRFFRASTARANSISGNGLGLAIVKSIVERHGGEVSVESELEAGSRFAITLPLVSRVEAPVPNETESVGGLR
jgi:signal transduction histidine kinase